MAEYGEMVKAEEHLAVHRKADIGSATEHETGAGYAAARLRHANLGGRSNAGTRAQLLLHLQRTHGNRAVQRQADGGHEPSLPFRALGPLTDLYEPDRSYKPGLPPFLGGPLTWGFDYLLHSIGPSSLPPIRDPRQPTVPEIVQDHIAKIQGTKAFIEGEQARKHDVAIDDAQRAITGLPPDWLTGEWKEPPGTLERPQYDDVSPALNQSELDERAREREMYEAMGIR